MKDQVKSMTERGLSAVYVGDVNEKTEENVCLGKFQLIFMSPEMLLNNKWRDLILSPHYSENLKALIVDEAHCVQKWYVLCSTLLSLFPGFHSLISIVLLIFHNNLYIFIGVIRSVRHFQS